MQIDERLITDEEEKTGRHDSFDGTQRELLFGDSMAICFENFKDANEN